MATSPKPARSAGQGPPGGRLSDDTLQAGRHKPWGAWHVRGPDGWALCGYRLLGGMRSVRWVDVPLSRQCGRCQQIADRRARADRLAARQDLTEQRWQAADDIGRGEQRRDR